MIATQQQLQAEMRQKDHQLNMQPLTIEELEARVRELLDEVAIPRRSAEQTASNKKSVCEKKCNEATKKLCCLGSAIAIHSDAVKDVVKSTM